jgi:hypothetical protein
MSTLTVKSIAAPVGYDLQMPAGSILQVENAVLQTNNISTTSQTYVDTGLADSITPKFSTSKILIHVDLNGIYRGTATGDATFNLVRGSTELETISSMGMYHLSTGVSEHSGTASFTFLDSPNTTSGTTYKVQFKSITGSTVYVNLRYNASNVVRSSITLQEVAG